MNNFIFILGGVRSGKSRYAVERANSIGRKVCYIATCNHSDKEMAERIKLHKDSRPSHWQVIEEGKNLSSTLNILKDAHDAIIIDCLGLLISNLLAENLKDETILERLRQLTRCISKRKRGTIVVSNEVGSGIVPENPLARRFRDLVGRVNQLMAEEADEVIVMQAGLPIKIKG